MSKILKNAGLKAVEVWVKTTRYSWSNLRMKKNVKINASDYASVIPKNISEVGPFITKMYKNFKWTMDDPKALFDLMESPEYCWKRLHDSPPLLDDCDGYHAAIMWALSSNFDVRLLTLIPREFKDSHTIVIFRTKDGILYVLDYDKFSRVPDTKSIESIFETCRLLNRSMVNISSYEISGWKNGKWYSDKTFLR